MLKVLCFVRECVFVGRNSFISGGKDFKMSSKSSASSSPCSSKDNSPNKLEFVVGNRIEAMDYMCNWYEINCSRYDVDIVCKIDVKSMSCCLCYNITCIICYITQFKHVIRRCFIVESSLNHLSDISALFSKASAAEGGATDDSISHLKAIFYYSCLAFSFDMGKATVIENDLLRSACEVYL